MKFSLKQAFMLSSRDRKQFLKKSDFLESCDDFSKISFSQILHF